MTFVDIPAATTIFLDANVLVYHFTRDPLYHLPCHELLERVGRREIQGATSTHALIDVAHRTMTTEAMAKFGWPAKGIANRLRQNAADISRLSLFQQAIQETANFGVQIFSVHHPHIVEATKLSQVHGLLSGDALLLAVMQDAGITHLASRDDDFDRVPGLTRYAPI